MSTAGHSLNWGDIDGSRRRADPAGGPPGDVEEPPAVRRAPPGLDLAVDRPGDLVPGQQLGWAPVVLLVVVPAIGLVLGLRRLLAEEVGDVVEHEPVAAGVLQDAAVTAHALGDQDP